MPYVGDASPSIKVPRLNIVEGERNKQWMKEAYNRLHDQGEMMLSDESGIDESSDEAAESYAVSLNGKKLLGKEESKTVAEIMPEGSMSRDDLAQVLTMPKVMTLENAEKEKKSDPKISPRIQPSKTAPGFSLMALLKANSEA